MVILWHLVWSLANVAGTAISGNLVAVANVLVIPLAGDGLVVGGPRQLSWVVKHVIAPASLAPRSRDEAVSY